MTSPAQRVLLAACAAVLAAGVAAQFAQSTDQVFPLRYFSADSALLCSMACAASLAWPSSRSAWFTRGMSAVGVLVSAIVYATVIAPASATGTWFQPWDDGWVRAAIVLMHGAGPVLAAAQFLVLPGPPARAVTTAALWCVWPAGYLAAIIGLAVLAGIPIPYPFLDPHAMGGLPVVLAAVLAIWLVTFVVGVALLRGRVLIGRAFRTP